MMVRMRRSPVGSAWLELLRGTAEGFGLKPPNLKTLKLQNASPLSEDLGAFGVRVGIPNAGEGGSFVESSTVTGEGF